MATRRVPGLDAAAVNNPHLAIVEGQDGDLGVLDGVAAQDSEQNRSAAG
jgi:hypothetical protein